MRVCRAGGDTPTFSFVPGNNILACGQRAVMGPVLEYLVVSILFATVPTFSFVIDA